MTHTAALLALALCSAASAQDITSRFATNAEGWITIQCNCGGNYGPIIGPSDSSWQGGPGVDSLAGYLQATDPFGNCNFYTAPAAFTGNLASRIGGRLDYSLRSNVVDWVNDNVVVLVSSDAPVLVYTVALPTPVNTWINYSVPLRANAGWRVGSKTGTPATTAEFAAAMGSLTALRISAEYGSTAPEEIVGLDNVNLSRGCGPADLGSAGGLSGGDGLLDNNDFIAFINYFFSGDFHADLGRAGGFTPGDGAYDNNDFIAFITLFFEGCD